MSKQRDGAPSALERWVPAVTALLVFVVASLMTRPVVFPDESASLAAGRFLAGLGEPAEWWFQPGYGFVLAPIFWVTTDLLLVMVGVHIVNAALAGSVAFALVRIDRILVPDRSSHVRAVAVLLVSAYPAYLYFAGLAISDNLVAAAAVWAALLVARVQRVERDSVAMASVVAISALMVVHARALPLVIAWVAVVATERFRGRASQQAALVGVALGSVIGFRVIGSALSNYQAATALAPLTRQSIGELVTDLVGLRALMVLPFTALGQVMYLVMATLGLAVIGLVALAKLTTSDDDQRRSLARFAMVALVLSWALGSAFTNQGQGDLSMYGRYIEVVAAIPLLLGIGAIGEHPLPTWFRSRVIPGIVLLVCFVVGIRGYDAFGGRNQLLNISGTAYASRLVGQLDPVAYVLLIAVAMGVLYAVRQRHVVAGLVVIALFFGANTLVLYENARAFSERASERLTLLDDIGRLDEDACAALDQAGLTDFFTQENYRVNDLGRDYLFWSSAEDANPPCADLVISENTELGDVLAGWQPVAAESQRPQWLWVSPEVADVFDDRVIRPLPGAVLSSPTADVRVSLITNEADRDTPISVEVSITNTSQETFVPVASLPLGTPGVMLGLEWRDINDPDERLHEPFRVNLPSLIRPGQTVTVVGDLDVVTGGFTADNGEWFVRAELVQEFVQWFDTSGGGNAAVNVVSEVKQ